MNKAVPPLDNVKVREAIAHAVNRQELIDGAMFGYGTPIGTHFAPHHPDYVDLTAQSAYDPEKAKALLAEAGVSGLKLRLALPPTPYARRGGELMAAQLRAVGIETEITNMEWAQWLETVYKGKDYDLTIISHVEPMDIGIYTRDDYYFNYNNEALKAVMAEVNTTTDDAKRPELLKQAQKLIADDYANAYLFQLAKTGVANAKIEGLWENSPTPANDLSKVHWTE
jgi:peptide/nickel transport system substrate-binding protein